MGMRKRTNQVWGIKIVFLSSLIMGLLYYGCEVKDKVPVTDITIEEIGNGFEWCFRAGAKQALGAYQNGLSIHQITRTFDTLGNPDYIFWVDERSGTCGISREPTGNNRQVINPGGNVVFDEKGYIWYTYGGRSQDLNFNLYRSFYPYDCENFTLLLGDFISQTDRGSTSVKVTVNGNKVILQWRNRGSTKPDVKARVRCYDMFDFENYEHQTDIGTGMPNVCIEQMWSRFDPRYRYLISSFHFFQQSPRIMGSGPYFYSKDNGKTWLMPDGRQYTNLPLDYSEAVSVGSIPWDHIGDGNTGGWIEYESGVTPDGKFWMTSLTGATQIGKFFLWDNETGTWQNKVSFGSLRGRNAGFSCGATKDKMVIAFTQRANYNSLYAVVSSDNGASWSDPVLLDVLEKKEIITWVSYCQPSQSYDDNYGRFFYAYYRKPSGDKSHNNIKFVRFKAN
jgi:hypothetical protein